MYENFALLETYSLHIYPVYAGPEKEGKQLTETKLQPLLLFFTRIGLSAESYTNALHAKRTGSGLWRTFRYKFVPYFCLISDRETFFEYSTVRLNRKFSSFFRWHKGEIELNSGVFCGNGSTIWEAYDEVNNRILLRYNSEVVKPTNAVYNLEIKRLWLLRCNLLVVSFAFYLRVFQSYVKYDFS